MATSVITGTAGDITWASDGQLDDNVTAWAVEASVSFTDVTSVDSTWREYLPGHYTYTATVDTLNTNNAVTTVSGSAASLTLTDGTNNIALANTICTGISKSNEATGPVTATYTFVIGGAID